MLTLKKFELQISNTIVQRGKAYYENGAVTGLKETGKGAWHAEVEGSEIYEVEVGLVKKNQINSYSCGCPYEGEICKHVVAVLFLLREEFASATVVEKVRPATGFSKLLQKISLEEYQEFILGHAAKDKAFKSLFERHFADKDRNINVENNYTKLLKSLIRNNSREDFIDYRFVHKLAKEINELLEEGGLLIQKGNFRNAFILARSVLTEVIELITYCDDSGGYIGDIISSSIALIAAVAGEESAAVDLQEEIFSFLQSAISRPIFFDYGDFGYEMSDVYQTLSIKLNKERAYLNFVDREIKKTLTDEYSYRKEYFISRKISFLRAIGNLDVAQQLVHENLDIVEIRQEEVNSLIAAKDVLSAKKLIIEGIKIAQKEKHPGTVAKWEKELLRIAILENDKRMVRHYTKYFAFDRGFNPDYYHQWKHTFTIEEWEQEIEKYIEERIADVALQYQKNKGKVWYLPDTVLLDLLAPVYIEEKYWDRLLVLMSKETDLDRLLQYHRHLIKIYPVQLLAIYLPAFERKGDVAGGRREYADLVIKMEKVIRDIPEGKDEIIAIAEGLIRKYPRRPAMIQELNTLVKKRN